MHSLLIAVSDIFQKRKMVNPAIVAVLTEPDVMVVRELSSSRHWAVSFAADCPDALARIGQMKAQILFLDRDLAGPGWRQTIHAFASSSTKICIMVVSKVVDTNLWNEVVRYGGYEVLSKPLQEGDLLRAVNLAWSYWSSSAGSVKR